MKIYTEPEVYKLLEQFEGWEYTDDGMLVTTYQFENFLEAVSFVNDLAGICEELHHHADIDIRYDRVSLATCTHDKEGAITQKDVQLMTMVEALVE